MSGYRSISTRARVVLPIAALSAAITRVVPATAQTDDDRQAQSNGANDPLSSLLKLVPNDISTELNVTFADIAAQLDAADLPFPDSIEDDDAMDHWIDAIYPIAIASPFRENAFSLDRTLLGFDVTDIDQSLESGIPPNMITLIRGRFDHAAVNLAWAANGYKMLDVNGVSVASVSEDASINLESEIGRIALARMNNAAFLADDTLVYTATLALMTDVIATAAGEKGSLADRVDVSTLLQSVDGSLASAILFDGVNLSVAAMVPPDLLSTPEALEDLTTQLSDPALPPISIGLIGITPGGPTAFSSDDGEPILDMDPATVLFRLLMTLPGTADDAVDVVDARLGSLNSAVTQQPYTEFFSDWAIDSVSDGSVLAIDLTLADGVPATIWTRMLFQRDLLFLAW